jgi:hypothetical protein
MLRLATDADFNGNALAGLRRREPALDIVSVHEAGLSNSPDPEVLEWAATQARPLISHDRRTMVRFANERIATGLPMPGLFIIRNTWNRVGDMVEEILTVAHCSEAHEWSSRVVFLPL